MRCPEGGECHYNTEGICEGCLTHLEVRNMMGQMHPDKTINLLLDFVSKMNLNEKLIQYLKGVVKC